MASTRRSTPLLNPDPRELEAQQVACSYLVKGCERALFDFGLIAGETSRTEAAAIDKRAADIMREVLGSWRETLAILRERASDSRRQPAANQWVVMQTRSQDSYVNAQSE